MAEILGSRAAQGVDARANSTVRFTLTVAAWVVGLFGLMRVGWVQQHLLLPFAGVQQRLAIDLMGAPSNVVVVDLSCTGADAIALCLGVIFAFPTSLARPSAWWHPGPAADHRPEYATNRHSIVCGGQRYAHEPAPHLCVASGPDRGGGRLRVCLDERRRSAHPSERTRPCGAQSAGVGRRFLLLTGLLVAAYFALAPSLFQSALLLTVGGWAASSARAIILTFGGAATVSGNVLSTAHGSFIVTQECLASPLIPVYAAAALSMPLSLGRRATVLLVGPLLFFCLGTSRLLVLALPNALVSSHVTAIHAFSQVLAAIVLIAVAAFWRRQQPERGYRRARVAMLAIGVGAVLALGVGPVWNTLLGGTTAALQSAARHAGHTFGDAQGAIAMLPSFQLGLLVALWIAVERLPTWRHLIISVAVLALSQAVVSIGLGELYRHIGFDPHVSLVRAWGLGLPIALALILEQAVCVSSPPRPA